MLIQNVASDLKPILLIEAGSGLVKDVEHVGPKIEVLCAVNDEALQVYDVTYHIASLKEFHDSFECQFLDQDSFILWRFQRHHKRNFNIPHKYFIGFAKDPTLVIRCHEIQVPTPLGGAVVWREDDTFRNGIKSSRRKNGVVELVAFDQCKGVAIFSQKGVDLEGRFELKSIVYGSTFVENAVALSGCERIIID